MATRDCDSRNKPKGSSPIKIIRIANAERVERLGMRAVKKIPKSDG
jgi:hypothetical protein